MATFTAAIIQHPPVFLDLKASIDKALALIKQASGAQVIAFPETWLPGYPLWLDFAPNAALWDHPPAKQLFSILWNNSAALDSPELAPLAEAACTHKATIVMGAHERLGGTLYNSILYFTPEQGLATVHRKLMPTYTERMLWGMGDGSTLSVIDTPHGPLGGLICWEHWMPLARAAMHAKHELLHVAQWPMVKEMNLIASRQYAFEGQCFVLAAGQTITRAEILSGPGRGNEVLESIPGPDDALIHRGGSAIIAPDGSLLAGPVFDKSEILTAEINPDLAVQGRMYLDVDGHYSRPDIFRLEINVQPLTSVAPKL
ncbi:MAG: carbon-nitrogen hydrolase family protein [Acidimicrobiia bacterium]|nr:carbon-nitrogen hydrolase family protein [Acidimicrobiia bacterium]